MGPFLLTLNRAKERRKEEDGNFPPPLNVITLLFRSLNTPSKSEEERKEAAVKQTSPACGGTRFVEVLGLRTSRIRRSVRFYPYSPGLAACAN